MVVIVGFVVGMRIAERDAHIFSIYIFVYIYGIVIFKDEGQFQSSRDNRLYQKKRDWAL